MCVSPSLLLQFWKEITSLNLIQSRKRHLFPESSGWPELEIRIQCELGNTEWMKCLRLTLIFVQQISQSQLKKYYNTCFFIEIISIRKSVILAMRQSRICLSEKQNIKKDHLATMNMFIFSPLAFKWCQIVCQVYIEQ